MSLTMRNPAIILPTNPTNAIGTILTTTTTTSSSNNNNNNYINSSSQQQKFSSSSSTMLQPLFITNVSPEIFSKICETLSPVDIFKLSKVCKHYYNLLCTPSNISQNIWRTSRMKFLSYPKLPPPQGMDEMKYIKITNFDESCEFCGNCEQGSSRIYWEFRVRCCDTCLLKRTKTYEQLKESAEIPIDVIEILPCVWIRGGAFAVPVHRYYWIDNLISIGKEYSSFKRKDYANWLSKKKEQHKSYMGEVSQYYYEDQKRWNDMQKKYRNS